MSWPFELISATAFHRPVHSPRRMGNKARADSVTIQRVQLVEMVLVSTWKKRAREGAQIKLVKTEDEVANGVLFCQRSGRTACAL